MKIVIKKFGGTSVGSIQRIEAVADRLKRDIESGQRPIVVASAMSGETNRLVQTASEVHPSFIGSTYDMILASGEQVAVALLSMAIEKRGIKAHPLLAFQLNIETDSSFSPANTQCVASTLLKTFVDVGILPV